MRMAAARQVRQQLTTILAAARARSEAVIRAAGLDPAVVVPDVRPAELPAVPRIPVSPPGATPTVYPVPDLPPRPPIPLPAGPVLTETTSPAPVSDMLDAVSRTVYRNSADAYAAAVQDAIETTRGGLPASSISLSRIQAAQKALDTLADQGITGFTDRAGRNWDLVSYVEMATRTAVSNAWDNLQNRALVRGGNDLVLVFTLSTEGSCPHCLPWLGKVLSLTGATTGDIAVTLADGTPWRGTVHATLAEAREAGFRHPNCRCSMLPIVNGMDLAPTTWTAVPDGVSEQEYAASQRQRALERQVRRCGRQASAAVTPHARNHAARDLRAARAAADQHARDHGLRITRGGRGRREHPINAR
jgi:hypothetical protein